MRKLLDFDSKEGEFTSGGDVISDNEMSMYLRTSCWREEENGVIVYLSQSEYNVWLKKD